MPATLQTLTPVLKEVYETDDINDQLQSETVGLKRIERTSEGTFQNAGGKYVVFPLRVTRNHGIGARAENQILPNPGQQGYASGQVALKYQYGGVRITGQVIELADGDPKAFANMMDKEIVGLKNDLAKDQNRQLYGDGRATLATATAVTTAANNFTALPSGTNFGAKYVEVGMQVDVSPAAGGAPIASNRKVTAVNQVTGVVTLDGSAWTSAIGDRLVRQGSDALEITGLAAIVKATGILYNIDPSNVPLWAATVDGAGGALSEGQLIKNVDTVRANGSKVSVLLSGLGVRRAYFNLLVQQRRYTNTQNFEGGFSGLAFTTDAGDVPFVVDNDCPPNTVYGLTESELKIYRPHEWKFMDRDGSMWSRVTGGQIIGTSFNGGQYDAYEAYMYLYWELATHKRNAHFVMTGVTEG